MNFSAWSIRNPIAPILAFFILMVLGWQSFNALPITRFPNIDIPLTSITAVQQGAAPAEIETQITKPIEDAMAGVTGVKNIRSTVTDGVSSTIVEFSMDVPTDKAVQDTKDAIDAIAGNLPASIDPPTVTRIDVEGQAIMTFAVSAPDMSFSELSWFVDDVIKREIQGGTGIGRVTRFGGADREVRIELDPVKLGSYGLTAFNVSQQLRGGNTNLGSGRSTLGQSEQAIRTLGDAQSIEGLANTRIALPTGNDVRLKDLGTVIDGYEDLRSFSRLNGQDVVSFSVYRAKGASEITVSKSVEAALEKVRAAHPQVEVTLVDDTVFYTYGNYEAALNTLVEGAVLAVLVVLLFLRNWRATLISAVALPLSAIPTFFVMDLLGFSLNLVSFLALTLATGILVDDAIVEVENIARHIRMGKTPFRAAIEAADEIGLAVIATTFTIIAIFVPVSFMPGIPGQYFSQFGLTVAFSVLFSLLVARLITPMMAAYLMRAQDAVGHNETDGPLMAWYLRFVAKTLRHPYFTLLGAVMILMVSLFFMAQIPGSFIPPEDVSRISVSVELPPGSDLDETRRTTNMIVENIKDIEGIRDIFVLGGSSPTGERDIRRASVTVLLDRLDHSILRRSLEILDSIPILGYLVPVPQNNGRVIPQREIEAEIFARIANVPDVRAFKLNDRGERDLSFSIMSDSEADLNAAVAQLEIALSGDPLLANVASSGALQRPEVHVIPREAEAAKLGLTTEQISQIIRISMIGDSDANLAKVSLDDRQIPVRLQVDTQVRSDISRILALKIVTPTGLSVPLSSVADVIVAQGPSVVSRLNRERVATIGANLPAGVALGTATKRVDEVIAQTALPPSVRLAPAGDADVQAELVGSFQNAMILGLMLVLAVLILLFKSVLQPFTILLSLPLAIGGVAAALIFTNSAVSMPVLIGIIMLMGIVTKNAILLVDFAIDMRKAGMDRVQALMEAGHKRARPIIMTSIAMSAGMLPSAMGVGEGGSFRAPMATAVIGGIIVSTALSLVVVPAFYLIMDDLSRVIARLFGRFIGPTEKE